MNTERTTECYTEVDLMYREVYNMHTWRSNWLLYRGASHIHKCTCTYTQKGEVVAIWRRYHVHTLREKNWLLYRETQRCYNTESALGGLRLQM